MTLKEMLYTIVASNPEDWTSITCWGAGSGPSYRDKIEVWEKKGKATNVVHVESHGNVAAFKNDLSITMAWGITCNDNFREKWANQFPDAAATSEWIDVFYNGALVLREMAVTVDGGRAKLPLPDPEMKVPSDYAVFVRLVDRLSGHTSDFTDYLRRAGIQMVDTPWPE